MPTFTEFFSRICLHSLYSVKCGIDSYWRQIWGSNSNHWRAFLSLSLNAMPFFSVYIIVIRIHFFWQCIMVCLFFGFSVRCSDFTGLCRFRSFSGAFVQAERNFLYWKKKHDLHFLLVVFAKLGRWSAFGTKKKYNSLQCTTQWYVTRGFL